MRSLVQLLVILALAAAWPGGATGAPGRPPNIVLIFADDLGWMDVGYQGNDFHETPIIDRLAAEGMVFSAAYAAAGNCAPSRACLLSGKYTPRHHVYAVRSTDRGPQEHQRLVPIPNRSGLDRDTVTIADALQAAGYATGIFGKWHLDGPEGAPPEAQGFDTVYQSHHTWDDADAADPANPKGAFSLTRGACEFIERHRDRPFFVYLSHYSIHTPLEARPESLDHFTRKPPGARHGDPLYAACLHDLDTSVGILLAKLAELGLEENTLVVFTSDNGGTQDSSQEPLRGNKGSYYEGGIREPFIVRWPAVVRPGSRCDVPVINVDLFPTFLAAAGVSVPAGTVLDGESLLPLLRGDGGLARRGIFWHFPGYLGQPVIRGRDIDVRDGFRSRPVTVMNEGGWKLHLFHEEWRLDGGRARLDENGAVELYDLATDIGERHDLARSHPEKRDEMLDRLLAWIDATNALVPAQPNPAYRPAERTPAAATRPPNLIWIMADDLGYGELGSYGQQVIATPHLDGMAREGLRFTRFYAGATVCAPSRSVLMTGLHQGRTRVRGNAGRADPAMQALRDGDATVAGMLQSAGYATALVGKWGLGDVGAAASGLPRRHGFDSFFGFLNQSHAHNHFPDFLWHDEKRIALPNTVTPAGAAPGAGYATDAVLYADDLFADEALKFVAHHQQRPFFLFWSLVIPHANNERTRAIGNGAEVPDFGPYATADWPDQDKGQAAMITRMDGYVGRLLAHLRQLGIADDTLVIFTSDNGPHDESDHDLTRFQPAGPLRGIKRSLADGGIRVPAIAWWPGTVPPGTVSDHVAYFGDWFATAAELAGATPPAGLDSISFAPTLRGVAPQPRHEFLYWEFHERGFSQAALYDGRWKGIRERSRAAPVAVYDLDNDIHEQTDVAERYPEVAARIDAYLKTARQESADWPPRDESPDLEHRGSVTP